MAIRVLCFEEQHPPWLPYANNPAFLTGLQSKAARVLADTVIRKAARYLKIEPKREDANPVVVHRWYVGIESVLGDVEARRLDMEEARLQGRREAAELLQKAASDQLHYGDRKLHDALLEYARKIEANDAKAR